MLRRVGAVDPAELERQVREPVAMGLGGFTHGQALVALVYGGQDDVWPRSVLTGYCALVDTGADVVPAFMPNVPQPEGDAYATAHPQTPAALAELLGAGAVGFIGATRQT